MLDLAGIGPNCRVVVGGMGDQPHFKEAMLGEAGEFNSDRIEAEVVACGRQLQSKHPDMSAIVIECSVLPPYAKAVQDATSLPVFDFVTMIDYCYAGAHRKTYEGYYDVP